MPFNIYDVFYALYCFGRYCGHLKSDVIVTKTTKTRKHKRG